MHTPFSPLRLILSATLLLLTAIAASVAPARSAPGDEVTTVRVTNDVVLPAAQRFGINLGGRDQFGAAQSLNNLLPNPGFEGAEYAMIFHAIAGATVDRVQADNWNTTWNNDPALVGQPEGFWEGGTWEVIDGAAIGRNGTITAFTHEDNLYTFHLADNDTLPATGDVFVVRTRLGHFTPDTRFPLAQDAPGESRPGSPGNQSLRLLPPGQSGQSSWFLGLDSYGRDGDHSAGKLLLVQGEWQLTLWAKSGQSEGSLWLRLWRAGEATFFDETIPLTDEWQLISRSFTVPEGDDPVGEWGPDNRPQALTLEFRLEPGSSPVLVDDGWLGAVPAPGENAVFNPRLVAHLHALRPGVLRNWSDHSGASLENQLATPEERLVTGFAPRYRLGRLHHYSLHEYLELCAEIGADPWYVIPSTFSDSEMQNLAAWLAAPAGAHPYADRRAALGQAEPWTAVFGRIHLEFGNEIWGSNFGNDPFQGASLRGGERTGRVSHARFSALRSSPWFDAEKFNLIIGGQVFNPLRQTEIESHSSAHDTLALAPYFGKLYTWETPEARYHPLYAYGQWATGDPESRLLQSVQNVAAAGQGTGLAIYELNLFAIDGEVPLDVRNGWLTGVGAGIALPLTMLHYQHELGINPILAYRDVQYSWKMANGEYARLWGLIRDLMFSGNARPAWRGIELANRAVRGDLVATEQSGANPTVTVPAINSLTAPQELALIRSYGYRDGERGALVLFNLDLAAAQTVELDLPEDVDLVAQWHLLTGTTWEAGNESAESVTLTTTEIGDFSADYRLTLPPFSMSVITWEVRVPTGALSPVAHDDRYFGEVDGVITGNVLENDADPAGLPLTVFSHTLPAFGVLVIQPDGSFIYLPKSGFTGSDSFTYIATNGSYRSERATVTLQIMGNPVWLPIIMQP